MSKKREMIPLYNEDFKLVTGAMPMLDPDNPRASHKAILKRIRETFKLNRKTLERIHEERHQEMLVEASRRHITLGRWSTAYQTFKKTVLNMINEGKSVNNAIRGTFNTTWFTPEAVRGRHNMWGVIKRDPSLFAQLRRYSGWNKKVDMDKLHWDPENKMYWYGENVAIQKVQSPKKGKGNIILRIIKYAENNVVSQEDFSYDPELWEALHASI